MFDRVMMVDWSARGKPSPARPSADAIWLAEPDAAPVYCRTRSEAMQRIARACDEALAAGQRLLVGFDFPFGYPAGFAQALTGHTDPFAVWAWLADRIEDAPDNRNNRFDVAEAINRRFPGTGPFWGCPPARATADLPMRRPAPGHGMSERRAVEMRVRRAQPCWKLYTTGSVGSQALLGLACLDRLRRRFAADLSVWPFQPPVAPLVLAEVYPSLLSAEVLAEQARRGDPIRDRVQVALLSRALHGMARAGTLGQAFDAAEMPAAREEAWILGVGAEDALRAALA